MTQLRTAARNKVDDIDFTVRRPKYQSNVPKDSKTLSNAEVGNNLSLHTAPFTLHRHSTYWSYKNID